MHLEVLEGTVHHDPGHGHRGRRRPGLSIVLANVFTMLGIPVKVSAVVTVINAILLILAWLLIGKEFGAKTVYTAMILGPLLEFWEKVCPYERLIEAGQTSIMADPLLDLICFVLVVSISQTILFSINASTGGLDILAKIVNKYLHFDIGVSVTVAGALICCTAFAINPFRMVVIGQALLTQDEFSHVMDFVKKHDIHAFITAGNVSEVYGMWNKTKHKKVEK